MPKTGPAVHVFTTMCRSEWFAISLNIVTIVLTVAFVVTLHLFESRQKRIEKVAGKRNPYDGFIGFTFWSSLLFSILLSGIVAYQIVRHIRIKKLHTR